ncbi:MAG: hypothetical protein O2971_02500 [Proteobacteria bacterium]|nr:hypothetical protein [Pseudomonadota bacterium]
MVFYKDFRQNLRLLWGFLYIMLSWYLFFLLLLPNIGDWPPGDEFWVVTLSVASVSSVMFAAMAGMAVISDELLKTTHLFLLRLPISRSRILVEKLAAGCVFLVLLYALVLVYYYTFVPTELDPWAATDNPSIGTLEGNLFLSMYSAFFVALAFSRLLKQQLAIFLATLAVELLLWVAFQAFFGELEFDSQGTVLAIVYLLLFFGVPGLLFWKQWTFAVPEAAWGSLAVRTPLRGMLWTQFARNGLINVLTLLLFVAASLFWLFGPDIETLNRASAFVVRNSIAVNLLSVMALFLPIAAGANSYAGNDGDGLECIAYSHPISRSHLFFLKLLAALPVVVLSWVSALIVIGNEFPAVSFAVYFLFAYIAAVHVSLWMRSPMMVIMATVSWVIMVFFAIAGWMEERDAPWYFTGFTPVNDPALVGLIPLSLITVATFITSWHMATNRHFLSESKSYRERYNFASTCITLIATVAIVWLIRRVVVL